MGYVNDMRPKSQKEETKIYRIPLVFVRPTLNKIQPFQNSKLSWEMHRHLDSIHLLESFQVLNSCILFVPWYKDSYPALTQQTRSTRHVWQDKVQNGWSFGCVWRHNQTNNDVWTTIIFSRHPFSTPTLCFVHLENVKEKLLFCSLGIMSIFRTFCTPPNELMAYYTLTLQPPL